MILVTGDIYEGYWKDGKFNGKGRLVWYKNRLYEGQWKDGIKEGRGVFHYQNGDKYDG
jgi:hypothetical protein